MNRSFVLATSALLVAFGSLAAFGEAHAETAVIQRVPQETAAVFVGGTGASPHIETVLDDLADYLSGKQVSAKQFPDSQGTARNQLAERVKESGGGSLLYLSLDTGESQSDVPFRTIRLKAQCVSADGSRLWEEESSVMVWGTMPTAVKGLVKKLTKKLDGRIGQPGLPTAQ